LVPNHARNQKLKKPHCQLKKCRNGGGGGGGRKLQSRVGKDVVGREREGRFYN